MNVVWSEQIDLILSCGFSLDCMGIKNWALRRDDALRAINELAILGVPILGGDVYQLVNGVVEQTYDNWYCDQMSGELDAAFLTRSLDRAKSYIFNCSLNDALFAIVPKF